MSPASPSVSIRIAMLSAAAVPGQLRHDLRTGVLPDYVDRNRVADNRVLVEPPSPARMRERTVERRARSNPRRALRRDAAIAVAGIVTWSREAQELIRAAPPDRQDAAYRAIAEGVGRHYGIGVLGLTVHVDESAPHAHVWWDARCEDGSALSTSLNTAHLQDLAAGALGPLFPQIGRGRAKRERRAAGEPQSTWVNRSVRELHADLPAEIAALERERDLARDRVAEMAARVSALETRQAELGALTDRERRRLATYAGRLADRERKLVTATAQLDAVRTAARRITTEAKAAAETRDKAEQARAAARSEAGEITRSARVEANRVRDGARRQAALAAAAATAVEVVASELATPQPAPGRWRQGRLWDQGRWHQVRRRLTIEWPTELWTWVRDLAGRMTALADAEAGLEDGRVQLRRQTERFQSWAAEYGDRLGIGPDPAEIETALAELDEPADDLPRPSPFDDGP